MQIDVLTLLIQEEAEDKPELLWMRHSQGTLFSVNVHICRTCWSGWRFWRQMDPDVVDVSDMIEHLLIGDFTPLKMHQTWFSPWLG